MPVFSPQIAALFLLDWCAAQGREFPANAKATNNDTAIANAMPSATATGRGKPSDFMAVSPQPARETANQFWRHNDLIEVKDRPRIAHETDHGSTNSKAVGRACRYRRLCLSPYAPSSSPAQKGIVGYSNRSPQQPGAALSPRLSDEARGRPRSDQESIQLRPLTFYG